jgi:hypothetical protein
MAKRKRVAVKPTSNCNFLYGFLTKSSTDAATFGHVDCESGTAPAKTVIFSPSSIQPTKATKSLATGSDSSFADTSKINPLITADYAISRKRSSVPKASPKSKVVGILLETGVYWCWRMALTRWTAIPADVKAAAGIAEITAFDVEKHAYNANGVILKAPAGGFAAGVFIGRADLRKTIASSTGKTYRVYAKLNDETP